MSVLQKTNCVFAPWIGTGTGWFCTLSILGCPKHPLHHGLNTLQVSLQHLRALVGGSPSPRTPRGEVPPPQPPIRGRPQHRQRMRLCVEHKLLERHQPRVVKQQVQIFECFCYPKALLLVPDQGDGVQDTVQAGVPTCLYSTGALKRPGCALCVCSRWMCIIRLVLGVL